MELGPGFAPAKVNLALHVTGQRADGYHLLDSLAVFAGVGDLLTVEAAPDLSLSVQGPFADGIPTDDKNIILRAARALRSARGVKAGAHITLEKILPHPAGIGGGSSDAAAALRLLASLWSVAPFAADAPELLSLGADVPVCASAPAPMRMRGIGERIDPVPGLPDCALVLVNPGVAVPTPRVFAALDRRDSPPLSDLPDRMSFDALCTWIAANRNDLLKPAIGLAPKIGLALDLIGSQPSAGATLMSGSGATCVGVFADLANAESAAAELRAAQPGWWIAAAPVLRG